MGKSMFDRVLRVTHASIVAVPAVLGLTVGAIVPVKAQTLRGVKERGALACGVNENLPGFAAKDAKGNGAASTLTSAVRLRPPYSTIRVRWNSCP